MWISYHFLALNKYNFKKYKQNHFEFIYFIIRLKILLNMYKTIVCYILKSSNRFSYLFYYANLEFLFPRRFIKFAV